MLTLIVPGLIWPPQALADLSYDLDLPAFSALLGWARHRRLPPAGVHRSLANLFAIDSNAPIPAAALRRRTLQPDVGQGDAPDTHWLCLDPAHLHLSERHMLIAHPARLRLDLATAKELAVALAPTFAELGELSEPSAAAPDAWHLRLYAAAPPFEPLPDICEYPAQPLPATPPYAPWRRALNEAQMLLHHHPINRQREAADLPTINSLWPWGGGALDSLVGWADEGSPTLRRTNKLLGFLTSAQPTSLWSNDRVARGLADYFGIPTQPLPTDFAALPQQPVVAIVDTLDQSARCGDAHAWREAVLQLERAWLQPALQALKHGQLKSLRLYAPGNSHSIELTLARYALLRFWRRPAPLTSLAIATE